MSRFAISITVALSFAVVAQGQLVFPMEQQRHMEAWVQVDDPNNTSDSASADAPDMSLWVHDIEASVDSCDGWCTLASGAGQYSDISGTALAAYGSTDVTGLHLANWALSGTAHGTNSYRVRFAVAAPVTYELSGFISVAGEVLGNLDNGDWLISERVDLRLDQIAGPLVHEQHVSIDFWPDPNQPASDSRTLAAAGQLSPGVYELEIVADMDCPYLYLQTYGQPVELVAEASFVADLTFTPAEAPPGCDDADTDNDGDVDLLDFYRFQRCYTGP
jgi:hypothetical protein